MRRGTSNRSVLHRTLPLPGSLPPIEGLQQLRCIAAMLVAWVHASQVLAVDRGVFIPTLGVFGVDVFFVISGFIVCGSALRAKQSAPKAAPGFLKRRLIRIFPIYWVVCSLGLIRLLFEGKLPGWQTVGALLLLPNFSTWSDASLVDGSWTLAFEVYFYAALFTCMLVASRLAAVLLLMVCLGACAVGGALFPVSGPVWNVCFNPILLEFIAGAALAILFSRIRPHAAVGATLLAAGLLLTARYALHDPGGANGMQMVMAGQHVLWRVATWGVAAWLVVAGVVLGALRVGGLAGRTLTILGNASYSAYLLEMYAVVYVLRLARVLVPVPVLSPLAATLHALCVVAAAMLLGWASYQWVEWPMLRALQRRLLHG